MCVYCYFYAVRHNIHSGGHFSARELLISTKDAIWALLMPLSVLGGHHAGVFTPTESAASGLHLWFDCLLCDLPGTADAEADSDRH